MHVLEIDRVLVATEDVSRATDRWNDLLGITFSPKFEEDGMESAISRNNSSLDFVAPTDEGEGADAVRRFLDEHGPGLYALALRVADVDHARRELAEKDIEPIYTEEQHDFLEYFYHPRHFNGVLLALSEFPHPVETNTFITNDSKDG